MIYKIVGVSNVSGEYQGHSYHNLMLQVEYEQENPKVDCIGIMTDSIKLKYASLSDSLQLDDVTSQQVENFKASYFQYLLGKKIKVYYNRYGQVEGVSFVNDRSAQNQTAVHGNSK